MSYFTKTALEIREIFLSKKASAVEITKSFIERINQINPEINAFINIYPELALKRAEELDKKLASGQAMGKLAGCKHVTTGIWY